jgi:hypothetical protein
MKNSRSILCVDLTRRTKLGLLVPESMHPMHFTFLECSKYKHYLVVLSNTTDFQKVACSKVQVPQLVAAPMIPPKLAISLARGTIWYLNKTMHSTQFRKQHSTATRYTLCEDLETNNSH